MAQSRTKVFHLEMEGQHYYFGSPKAMFDIMGEEKMGMKYQSFHSNISLKVGDVYTNRRRGFTIRVGLLGQAKTNRSNRWQEIINEGIASALSAQQVANAAPAEQPAATQTPVAEAPVIETPAAEAPTVAASQPAQEPTEKPTEHPVPRTSRKKKNNDIPEQLTLF